MSRKFALLLAVAGVAALSLEVPADAFDGARLPAPSMLPLDKVQFYYGGQTYCWYGTGWRGSGWYWCGDAWNEGVGWGGGYGWNGWRSGSQGEDRAPRNIAPGNIEPRNHVGGPVGGAVGGALTGHLRGAFGGSLGGHIGGGFNGGGGHGGGGVRTR